MWDSILYWMKDNQIGDITGVVGLVVTIVGFVVTIINVIKSKNASDRAKEAAEKLKKSIVLLESVVDFSSALATLREIKRAHRTGNWSLLPDRYASTRETLIRLRTSNIELKEDQQQIFQSAIVNLSNMEDAVERHLTSARPVDPVRFNKKIAADTDKLIEIFEELKSRGAGDANVE